MTSWLAASRLRDGTDGGSGTRAASVRPSHGKARGEGREMREGEREREGEGERRKSGVRERGSPLFEERDFSLGYTSLSGS